MSAYCYVVPTDFCQIRDERRTILVHFQHEEIIREIWKHVAGAGPGDPPEITKTSSIDFNSLKDAKEYRYKDVKYWVIEKLPDFPD